MLAGDAHHFDQTAGKLEQLNLSKKKPFESTLPTLEVREQNIEEAMRQYHQSRVLPFFQVLWDACKQFYANTALENHFFQMRMDMQDSRITTLEARLGRKAALLQGLPAWGVKEANLDYNIHYWCREAGLEPSSITSMTSRLVDQRSSLVRLEFLTETQRNTFNQRCEGVKCEWNISYQKCKMRTDPDITSRDRIGKQPFYALLDFSERSCPKLKKVGMMNLMLISAHCRYTHFALPPVEHFFHKSDMYWIPDFP